MRSSRLTALVLIGAVVVGGLVLDAADEPADAPVSTNPRVVAGVAMPAANPASTLSSTWYCAAGTARPGGLGDHVLLILNPTDTDRTATITVLPGTVATPPTAADEPATGDTTTTTAPPDTTTTTVAPPPPPTQVAVPAQTRIEVALSDLVEAPIASAIVEVDGGEIAVEHQVTDLREGAGGRATAPCSSTAARAVVLPLGGHGPRRPRAPGLHEPLPRRRHRRRPAGHGPGHSRTAAAAEPRRAGPELAGRVHRAGHPPRPRRRAGRGEPWAPRGRPHPDLQRHEPRPGGHHARPRRPDPRRGVGVPRRRGRRRDHRADRGVQLVPRGGRGRRGGPPRRPRHQRRAGALRADDRAQPLLDRQPARARRGRRARTSRRGSRPGSATPCWCGR